MSRDGAQSTRSKKRSERAEEKRLKVSADTPPGAIRPAFAEGLPPSLLSAAADRPTAAAPAIADGHYDFVVHVAVRQGGLAAAYRALPVGVIDWKLLDASTAVAAPATCSTVHRRTSLAPCPHPDTTSGRSEGS